MITNKTVLIFIDWFTPGYKAGGPVSSNANLIAHLKKEFHFQVVTRNTEYMETKPYPGMIPNRWVQMDGFESHYISQDKLSFRTMKEIVKSSNFDVAYVNGIYSWYFSILPLFLLKFYNKRVIVSARGMLSPHALAVKSFKKNFFLKVCRTLGLYRNVTFHATNQEEGDYIRKVIGSGCKIMVAPNLAKPNKIKSEPSQKNSQELKLVYVGRIAPEKNTLFAIKTLKHISQKSSQQITLSIYGSIYDKEYWNECLTIIRELPESIKVIYQGTVEPSQIPVILKQHHFLFQPSKGENYGHTIAESLQNGIPVIISDRTPWRNLQKSQESGAKNQDTLEYNQSSVGWDIPLEHPEKFVEVIEYCARMEQEEYDAMSRRAFEYAKQVTEDPEVLEANRRLFDL